MLTGVRDTSQYPPPMVDKECVTGIIPVDFLIERFLEIGFEWFRTNPEAPNRVFGHLRDVDLKDKYGQSKIDEIATYIKNTEIDIKQAFPMEDEEIPSISINLQSSMEIGELTGLNDYAGTATTLGSSGSIVGGVEQGYSPIRDEVLIGIHASASSNKTKYLYYLVVYIINAYRDQLEARPDKINGLFNISWRATDISRMNDYLPAHVFTRFVTITAEHFAIFDKEAVPFIEDFNVIVEMEDGSEC